MVIAPDGTAIAPDGTAIAPDGTAIAPDGTAIAHDGTAIAHDGTAIACVGAAIRQAGTAIAEVRAMLTHVPVPDPARNALVRRLSKPGRTYHGLQHVRALWSRHLVLGRHSEVSTARASRLAACVIAFHDAVYDPQRQDNEQRSAVLWRRSARPGADMPASDIDWVSGTIEATEDHMRVPDTPYASLEGRLRLWVLDLDLTPLGEPPAAFRHNTALLRAEYRHLDDQSWNRRRLSFLRRLAAAPRIYRSPLIAAAFERQAQANLAREIASFES